MNIRQRTSMLDGDVRKLTLSLAGPGVLAMLAGNAAALLDALLLSRLGTQVTAAVGVCFPLLTLEQTIGFTLGTGAGSFASRSLGADKAEPARRAASCALLLAVLLSCLLLGLGMPFLSSLLSLLGASSAVLPIAAVYARFLLLSGPLLCSSLVVSSLLRALGQTRENCVAFVASSAVGTALCYYLSIKKDMGLAGAGIAMLSRESLCLVLLLFFLLRGDCVLRPSPALCLPRPDVLASLVPSGLPTLLRQGLMFLAGAATSRAAAAFGDAALAGAGLTARLISLLTAGAIGFGQGFQPVCGFAEGNGDLYRVHKAYRFCQRVLFIALLLCGALVFVLSPRLLALAGAQAEAVSFGVLMLRAQCATLPLAGAVILMNMLTQSMGLTLRASIVASGRQGYILLPLLLLLPHAFGFPGLALCQSVSDVLSFLFGWLLTRQLFDSEIRDSSCARSGYSDSRSARRSDRHSSCGSA